MKIGDKVVCLKDKWIFYKGPQYNEIVTISYIFEIDDFTFIELVEYSFMMASNKRVDYNLKYFRLVDYSFGAEVCEAIETEFTKLKEPIPA